jgi:hypothetical protein
MSRRFPPPIVLGALTILASYAILGSTAVVPQAPPQVCINGKCSTTPVTGAGVKWHPGHYMMTGTIVTADNASSVLSTLESEIDTAFVNNPNVVGYMSIHQWATLESTKNAYTFGLIDSLRSYIATKYPGKRYAVMIWATDYFTTNPGRSIPGYILSDSSYGAGYNNNQYGYGNWQIGTSGVAIAQWRPAVVVRLEALFTALANHPSPYSTGYTYDTDPYVEAVTWNEPSVSVATPYPPDLSSSAQLPAYQAQWEALTASMVASFPHTNVIDQNNYWPFAQNPGAVAVTVADCAVGAAAGSPDTYYPASSMTGGMQAFAGMLSGSGNQAGKCASMPFVEYPDYPGESSNSGATLAQIFSSAVTTVAASEIYWQNGWNFTSQVAPFINSNPIPSSNGTCPLDYSIRGGCNTK